MDWSKTKTIFIIAFLVLNAFLAFQFFAKKDGSQYGIIPQASLEGQLAAEGIIYSELPTVGEKGAIINAKTKEFTQEEIKKLKGQKFISLGEGSEEGKFPKIRMELNKPVSVPTMNLQTKVNQFLREYVHNGEQYRYWRTNEELNIIICVQQYNGKMIFQSLDNDIGMVILYLNSKDEIYAYEQKMLVDFEERDREQLLKALEAIKLVYNKSYLKPNSKVKIEYGYYTKYPLVESQTLSPTWHMIVESDKGEVEDLYVHAIEGVVLQSGN
ncbi:two-component system regulatory protein YycI [Metabacillus fastidiosus]|uniref:two-component system regulatory protein YycI n=1 Tax=Metabacillus fastidiosus TaxID=1458 RepID=UPI002DB7A603|nr:two-component system regulatory protein YycI [Metabacillus fastidiosus]MEC2075628.1 two-component system regulatory protein YycI [Metabacillus fastidiosus]